MYVKPPKMHEIEVVHEQSHTMWFGTLALGMSRRIYSSNSMATSVFYYFGDIPVGHVCVCLSMYVSCLK